MREENHKSHIEESVTKPRFEGNKYQDNDNESISEEEQEDLHNVVKEEKLDKIDLEVVQESYSVVKKLNLNKINIKLCVGPVSDELCPIVVN